MSKRFAVINNAGVVENVAIADDPLESNWIDLTDVTPEPGPGWTYDGSAFAAPPVLPEPILPRHITQYAFRQRFTQAERVAVEIASLDDPGAPLPARQQAAALRVSMDDLAQARYVDLDLPTVATSLAALESAGLLASGRANEILNAPVTPEERP